MITKLEQVKTAEELVTYTTCFGIPTDTESICRMQDIIGHSTEDELVKLATDDGTEIKDGHKWSTGRRGTQAQTMSILYHIWNWERATYFYNRHVNPETAQSRKTAEELKEMKEDLEEIQKRNKLLNDELRGERTKANEYLNEKMDIQEKLDKANTEIMRLKAMLFDYMTKTA